MNASATTAATPRVVVVGGGFAGLSAAKRPFDGRRHSVEATAVPLAAAGGRLLGALVVLWPGRMARSS